MRKQGVETGLDLSGSVPKVGNHHGLYLVVVLCKLGCV